MQGFVQPAPTLGNEYRADSLLRSCLARRLPAQLRNGLEEQLSATEAKLAEMQSELKRLLEQTK